MKKKMILITAILGIGFILSLSFSYGRLPVTVLMTSCFQSSAFRLSGGPVPKSAWRSEKPLRHKALRHLAGVHFGSVRSRTEFDKPAVFLYLLANFRWFPKKICKK